MAKLNFDSSGVPPQQAYDPIPGGWYPVMMVKSDIKPTKSEGGTMLEFELEVVDGEFKGRKVWDRLNIKNKSAKAQEIGQQQLSAICHATGVFQVADSTELHEKPFEAKIGLEPARFDEDTKTQYEARNTYKGARGKDGAAPTPASKVPAFVGKKPGAKAPPPPAAPEPEGEPVPEADERIFFVFIDGESKNMTGDEIRAALGEGMPPETPLVLSDESDQGWKTAGDYELEPAEAAPAAEAPPPPPPPPAKKAAPAAPGKKPAGAPPWAGKKK